MASANALALAIVSLSIALKVLLFGAYRSTDFEVHRNWLAITRSLPPAEWYRSSLSEWTLDYPPLFAWFEWALGAVATRVDPAMTKLDNLGYASGRTVTFQRSSVVVSELLLLAVAWWGIGAGGGVARRHGPRSRSGTRLAVLATAALYPGLLLVDHVHFQYNGFLIGFLALALVTLERGRDIAGGALFAALVCLKHLFLLPLPVVFVHLLRRTLFERAALPEREVGPVDDGAGDAPGAARAGRRAAGTSGATPEAPLPTLARRLGRFTALAGAVLAVFTASLLPFVTTAEGARALAGRLFPFDRGLLHAYWAPNFWALYAALDKVAGRAARALARVRPPPAGVAANRGRSSLASGLVGEAVFAVLPSPSGTQAAALTLLAQAPCLVALWRAGAPPARLPEAVAYAQLCGFVFGFHVHEKASLPFSLPALMWALAARDGRALRRALPLAAWSCYALVPLIHRPEDRLIRLALFAAPIALGVSALRLAAWGQASGPDAREEPPKSPRLEREPGDGRDQAPEDGETLGQSWLARALRGGILPLVLLPLTVLELVATWALPLLLPGLPFLPLALTSLACGAVVVGTWALEFSDWLANSFGGRADGEGGAARAPTRGALEISPAEGTVHERNDEPRVRPRGFTEPPGPPHGDRIPLRRRGPPQRGAGAEASETARGAPGQPGGP